MTTPKRMTPERLDEMRQRISRMEHSVANGDWTTASFFHHEARDLLAHIDAIEAERGAEVERLTRERDAYKTLTIDARREAAESARDTTLAQLAALREAAEAYLRASTSGHYTPDERADALDALRAALTSDGSAAFVRGVRSAALEEAAKVCAEESVAPGASTAAAVTAARCETRIRALKETP